MRTKSTVEIISLLNINFKFHLKGGGGGGGGEGGMVTDYSGTSILSNEFVVIGRASTDNLGFFWVCAPNVAHLATGGKKWLKKPKFERNEMELRSFRHWTRLNELIILV